MKRLLSLAMLGALLAPGASGVQAAEARIAGFDGSGARRLPGRS